MANQAAAPSRQWFRLPTSARPSPDPLPAQPLPAGPPVPKSPNLTMSSSPKLTVSAPPSPLILSPSSSNFNSETEAKEEQKRVVLVEKMSTSNKPNARPQVSKDDGNSETEGLVSRIKKINPDYEDSITLAGMNKGAMMRIIDFPLKKEKSMSSRNGKEGSNVKKEKRHKGRDQRMRAYINSNVQGINNSIVCNSSFSHHDPGVHASLFTNPSPSHIGSQQY